jgi:hypothetical protein
LFSSKTPSLNKINFFLKLRIFFPIFFSKRFWNFNNYLLGIRKSKNTSTVITDTYKNLMLILKLIPLLRELSLVGSKFLFVDADSEIGRLFYAKITKINQYCVHRPLNISGSLTNFSYMR